MSISLNFIGVTLLESLSGLIPRSLRRGASFSTYDLTTTVIEQSHTSASYQAELSGSEHRIAYLVCKDLSTKEMSV